MLCICCRLVADFLYNIRFVVDVLWIGFYRATPCSRSICRIGLVVCLSVCLSVTLSATSRRSTKMAKYRITKTTPHDSPEIFFSDAEDLGKTQTGSLPMEAPNAAWIR